MLLKPCKTHMTYWTHISDYETIDRATLGTSYTELDGGPGSNPELYLSDLSLV